MNNERFNASGTDAPIQEPATTELVMINGDSLMALNSPFVAQFASYGVLIGFNYEWDAKTAQAVILAESGGNPNAVNWKDYHKVGNCYGSFGLFQLACFRGSQEELLNPDINTRIAYKLWQEEGWKPWSVCREGIVKCY